MTTFTEDAPAAICHGVKVPQSRFMNETRVARINGGRYEGDEIRGALHVVREGDNVLELGAGIGLVGAVAAMNRGPARVIAFEANPGLIDTIEALYRLNEIENVISVRNQVLVAGAERPDTITFHLHKSYLGSSLNPRQGKTTEAIEVPTAGFDDLRQEMQPDVILMDIEGGELDFLENANLDGVRAIVMEFHPEVYDVAGMRRCKNILRDAGFVRNDELSTRTVWTAERA